ncbi:MAG: Hint domain-containing protein [Pseudomonadota bacterium]
MQNKSSDLVENTDRSRKTTIAHARRSFLLGSAALGVAVAANVIGSTSAEASRRRRRRRWRRRRGNNPTCFVAGTHLRTPTGNQVVEHLNVGDEICLADGTVQRIKWVGRMAFQRQDDGSWDIDTLPFVVKRGAIDGHAPEADLYVSGDHRLFIDGLLIPVRHLENGVSIARAKDMPGDEIAYFHIELDMHTAVLANGLPAETLQGGHVRRHFDNFADYAALYGDESPMLAAFAPIVGLNGGRETVSSHMRSAIAPVYDMRQPLDVIRDDLAIQASHRVAI